MELFYRNPQRPDFSWSRFMGLDLERPSTGRVYPQFFHLFPVFGAYLAAGSDDDVGLAAAVLVVVLFTAYFTVSLILRPFENHRELPS